MISYEEFGAFFKDIPGHSELEVYFCNLEKRYMLIKYEDRVSFARCGFRDGSSEFEYGSLDELYHATTVDGICLKRDWARIECVIARTSAGYFCIDDVISKD